MSRQVSPIASSDDGCRVGKMNIKGAFAVIAVMLVVAGAFTVVLADVPDTDGAADAEVTVTFEANGGKCDTNTMNTGKDGKLASLPTATREGYTFDGWYLGDVKVTTSTVFNADSTVVAHWTLIPVEPEKHVNGDMGTALGIIAFIVALVLLVVLVAVYKYEKFN